MTTTQIELSQDEIRDVLKAVRAHHGYCVSAMREIAGQGEHDGRAPYWATEYAEMEASARRLGALLDKLYAANDALQPPLEEAFAGMQFAD
jgi:hypothetical protein